VTLLFADIEPGTRAAKPPSALCRLPNLVGETVCVNAHPTLNRGCLTLRNRQPAIGQVRACLSCRALVCACLPCNHAPSTAHKEGHRGHKAAAVGRKGMRPRVEPSHWALGSQPTAPPRVCATL